MKFVWLNGQGARKAAITTGAILIVFSILVFVFPEFFAFVFAGIVLLMGVGLFFAGLNMPQKPPRSFHQSYGQQPQRQDTEDGSFEELP